MSKFYDLLDDANGKLTALTNKQIWPFVCDIELIGYDGKNPNEDNNERSDWKLEFEAEPSKNVVSSTILNQLFVTCE